jgi:SAM-dependent methyltransferase
MDPKELVRRGYDRVSLAYRAEDFSYAGSGYEAWLSDLLPRLERGSRVLDLGCGCGIPVSRVLAADHRVTGVDLSPVQIERARRLVPGASFLCADMTKIEFEPASFDAVVDLFAIIHVPLEEQPPLLSGIASWLKPGGLLLTTAGHQAWTGTEDDWRGVCGATMYWSHTDTSTYREWLECRGFRILEESFKPEDRGGHTIILAERTGGEAEDGSR